MSDRKHEKPLARRAFLKSTAALGAGLAVSSRARAAEAQPKADMLNVALLGTGDQGRALMNACRKIAGVRMNAICDIWTEYNLKKVSMLLDTYGHPHTTYVDYGEMLEKEKDLHAVLIATPDFCHAEHTVACLKAGLPVYCEAPMSNTVDGARQMMRAAKETGKPLQIGLQRRSNPRYIHCGRNLLHEVRILGQITTVNGQWNRAVETDRGWPRRAPIDEATLQKHGFQSMQQFRNWRWYKDLGGGPLASRGTHQLDVYNWFLGALPKAVLASGGTDYYNPKTHEWPDSIMAVLEYETTKGASRGFYQLVNTNSNLGYYEKFLGDEGALVISEDKGLANVYREDNSPDWDRWVNLDYLVRPGQKEGEEAGGALIAVSETQPPPHYGIPVKSDDPYCKPHLENFFAAVGGQAQLSCPPEVAYPSSVLVAKIYEAIRTGAKVEIAPDDFRV